jgi:hypothetical protein
MKADEKSDDWKTVSVELPVRYWIVALGAIDSLVTEHLPKLIKQHSGVDPTTTQMPDAVKAVIGGALSSRAAIVSALTKAGAMTPGAEKKFGLSALGAMGEKGRKIIKRRSNGHN